MKKEIKKTANLARLKLEEIDVSKVLDYIDLLKEVEGNIIEEDFQGNPLREDEVREEALDLIDNLKKSFPEKEKDYLKVKSILK